MVEGIIVGVITSAIIMLINALVRRAGAETRQAQREDEAMQEGMRSILHTHIIEICDRCMDRGYVHLHNLEAVDSMYKAYHDLGGNGTVTKCVEDFRQLPIK